MEQPVVFRKKRQVAFRGRPPFSEMQPTPFL